MSRSFARIIALGFAWLNYVHTGLSQGTIVYSEPSSPIILWYDLGTTSTAYHSLDVDGDGSIDFTFVSGVSFLGVRSEGVNRILIRLDPPPDIGGPIAPLPAGFLIGSGSSLDPLTWWPGYDGSTFDTLGVYFNTGNGGDFLGQRAYMGIEFQRGGNTHYGWVLLQVAAEAPIVGIESWAWETRAGDSISSGAVPEPSISVLLAIGIFALTIQHRRKSLC
jgi:hypothetical protein